MIPLPRLLTASSLERYFACAASAVLPRVESAPHPRTVRGSVIHRYLERVAQLVRAGLSLAAARSEALDETEEEYRAACEVIDLDSLPIDGMRWAQEVSFAFDVATGKARVIGHGLSREEAYSDAGPTEITGTADSVGISADGLTVLLTDYKTGLGDVTPAARNAQLRFLSLAASRAYGAVHARVALIKVKDDGLAYYDPASFDAFEVDGVALDLAALWDRVSAAVANPEAAERTGEYCKHCPSRTYCHARTAAVRVAVGEIEESRPRLAVTPENILRAWDLATLLEGYAEDLKRDCKSIFEAEPVKLANGLVFGPKRYPRDTLDGPIAKKVLAARFGDEVADRCAKWSVSKESVKRGVRAVTERTGEKFSHLLREVLAEIDAAGGVIHGSYTRVEPHAPDNQASIKVADEVAALGLALENSNG